jgi:tRNA-specific 2-thiouridylase
MGSHGGTGRYTVGQRRGLAVADGERLYVVGIEPERRRVVVGPSAAAGCTELTLTGVNWLGGEVGEVAVKHRYNEPAVPGRIELMPQGRAQVVLDQAQRGVAPGQACVCYHGTRLLGGGWIEQAPLVREGGAARLTA